MVTTECGTEHGSPKTVASPKLFQKDDHLATDAESWKKKFLFLDAVRRSCIATVAPSLLQRRNHHRHLPEAWIVPFLTPHRHVLVESHKDSIHAYGLPPLRIFAALILRLLYFAIAESGTRMIRCERVECLLLN